MEATREKAGTAAVRWRMRVTAVIAAALMAVLCSPSTALAASKVTTGGPNGPCGSRGSVVLALKYKGDAYVTYTNRDGKYHIRQLPEHRSGSYTHRHPTFMDGLRSWKLTVNTNYGYVSKQGSYGYCSGG